MNLIHEELVMSFVTSSQVQFFSSPFLELPKHLLLYSYLFFVRQNMVGWLVPAYIVKTTHFGHIALN
jgi:hypothetical protein